MINNIENICHVSEYLEELANLHLGRLETGGYTCNICSLSFRDKYRGKRHLESKHFPKEGGHSCPICGKVSRTKNALDVHMNKCLKHNGMSNEMLDM